MKKKNSDTDTQLNLFNLESLLPGPIKSERKTTDCLTFNLMDALRAPVITASSMWHDAIPDRLLKNLPLARMIALKKEEHMATYLECCIYLYTASLEAPMTHDWATISCHVSCKVMEDFFNEDHWKDLEAPKVLDDYRKSKLDRLRCSIYNKRRDLLKKKLKESK